MKGVFALAALALLAGCTNLNMFDKKAEPADKWTTWTCDSQAQVNWRFADQARTQVDVRLGQLAFHTKGEEGLVYWVATDDLIGRGCKAQ